MKGSWGMQWYLRSWEQFLHDIVWKYDAAASAVSLNFGVQLEYILLQYALRNNEISYSLVG